VAGSLSEMVIPDRSHFFLSSGSDTHHRLLVFWKFLIIFKFLYLLIRWSPDGNLLASGDDESVIIVWQLKQVSSMKLL
jgi:hypothetical protein